MLPKFFFENYFQGEQNNYIFVSMPFDNSLDDKFKIIEYVGKKLCDFDDVIRTKEKEWSGAEITDKIFDGIAHSRILLFDLSDDFKYNGEINTNVIYELGVALTFRDTKDILLIRKNNPEKPIEKLPFDIKGLNINEHKNGLEIEWLQERILSCKDAQMYYKELILASTFHSIDEIGMHAIQKFGIDQNLKNFSVPDISGLKVYDMKGELIYEITNPEIRNSVLKLLELGIVKTEFAHKNDKIETSFHWTFFGKKVVDYMKRRGDNY